MKKGIAAVMTTAIGAIAGAGVAYREQNKKLKKWQDLSYKDDAILKIFTQWLKMKQRGKSLADYFEKNNYKTIAIYGMHYLGECLVEELKGTDIKIAYAIDRNADNIGMYINDEGQSLNIIKPEETLPAADVIVVTAFYFFDEIEEMLSGKTDCPILSLEDIIYEME